MSIEGLLLLNKPRGQTSFRLVSLLRRVTGVKKIGHAGTLDPFATGVMVLLIGKSFTRLSDQFLTQDKEYAATLHLGIATDSFDCDGQITAESAHIPSLAEVQEVLKTFQGTVMQTPPMFSAKKIQGKKLYELARKGLSIERAPVQITLDTELLSYDYPLLRIRVACSKGTYIRSLADDIGTKLGCGAHLTELTRLRSGPFRLENCIDPQQLLDPSFNILSALQKHA